WLKNAGRCLATRPSSPRARGRSRTAASSLRPMSPMWCKSTARSEASSRSSGRLIRSGSSARRWPSTPSCGRWIISLAAGGSSCRTGSSMLWSKGLGALAALALAGALAGCFQPLYSEAAHPGLVEDLRAIEVQPIKDRIGHYLGDNLTTNLNGTGQTPTPKYKLTVTLSIGTSTPTVSSLTNVATSATLTADARYTLNKADGGAQVLTGVANANASY